MSKHEEIIKGLDEIAKEINEEFKRRENQRWISNIEREPTEEGYYDVILSDGKRYNCFSFCLSPGENLMYNKRKP